ncbi:MAG TPA: cupin domain-containing protein, partial [Actinomycetota bacterium]
TKEIAVSPGEIRPYLLGPDEGEALWVRGNRFTFKASGGDVGGGFAAVETLLHPVAAAPAHVHEQTDEALYVIEGEIVVEVGEERFRGVPGSFGFLPRGIPHRYLPQEPGPVRVLWFLSPAGFEDFWRDIGTPVVDGEEPPPPTPPDPVRMAELGRRYRTDFSV